jgi:hypothetical protein
MEREPETFGARSQAPKVGTGYATPRINTFRIRDIWQTRGDHDAALRTKATMKNYNNGFV